MSIQQSKSTFHFKKVGNRTFEERSWYCTCDFCGKEVNKLGDTPGDVSDLARKEGFKTVIVAYAEPLKWACPNCPKNKQANGKV